MRSVNLFTYGTLQFPELLHALTGLRLRPQPAFLSDFQRLRFREAVYPGILPVRHGLVVGMLYRGLDAGALARLDRFEGSEYRRRTLQVTPASGSTTLAICFEVTPDARTRLTADGWSAEDFEQQELPRYLKRCRRIGRALRRGGVVRRWL